MSVNLHVQQKTAPSINAENAWGKLDFYVAGYTYIGTK